MTTETLEKLTTRDVAEKWFSAVTEGRFDEALSLLDPKVEWINYNIIPGYNDKMPWIGTVIGPDAVLATLNNFLSVCEVRKEELVHLLVDGDLAAGVIYETSKVRKTKACFEIEFIQLLTIRDGKIIRWKSYTDPSSILRAIDGGEAK